jgi:hypothetical protein
MAEWRSFQWRGAANIRFDRASGRASCLPTLFAFDNLSWRLCRFLVTFLLSLVGFVLLSGTAYLGAFWIWSMADAAGLAASLGLSERPEGVDLQAIIGAALREAIDGAGGSIANVILTMSAAAGGLAVVSSVARAAAEDAIAPFRNATIEMAMDPPPAPPTTPEPPSYTPPTGPGAAPFTEPPTGRDNALAFAGVAIYEDLLKLWMHLENFQRVTPSREALLVALARAAIEKPYGLGIESRARAMLDLVDQINQIVEKRTDEALELPREVDADVIASFIKHMAVLLDTLFVRLEDLIFGYVGATMATRAPRDRLDALKDTFYWKRPR